MDAVLASLVVFAVFIAACAAYTGYKASKRVKTPLVGGLVLLLVSLAVEAFASVLNKSAGGYAQSLHLASTALELGGLAAVLYAMAPRAVPAVAVFAPINVALALAAAFLAIARGPALKLPPFAPVGFVFLAFTNVGGGEVAILFNTLAAVFTTLTALHVSK